MSSVALHSASAEDFSAKADTRAAPKVPGAAGPAEAPAIRVVPPDHAKATSSSKESGQTPPKRNYPAPAELPTQAGPKGVRFDFNDGCRVVLPEAAHPWRVRLSDLDTGNLLYQTELKGGRINSSKRYFIRFRLEIWQNGESIFVHDYAARDREVMIQFPVGTLGDPMGWFPYAVKFHERYRCRLTCALGEKLIALYRDAYPEITFLTHEEVKPERYYATYSLGLFFDDKDNIFQPCDFRHVGLHRTAGYILGVDPTEKPPRISLADDGRPIAGPYVCIDQKSTHGTGLIWNHIPNGAEDETGDRPLQERARWLKHAEFFIGLSSGLSWLAWAAGIPVVMISGCTHPTNEFETPYRVTNYHACNSCWNDVRARFDHKDFMWCPRHKDTPRQFECTRLITVDQVKAVIRTIPGFGGHQPRT